MKATKAKDPKGGIRFGTDGWRGVMAREFTFENVRKVAQAIADHARAQGGKQAKTPIVIGYDRRFQSDVYAAEIARIFSANGMKVTICDGPVPTPLITLLTKKLKALGIMVTASHNPASFNGIKIKLEGRAANEDVTKAVEEYLPRVIPARNGDTKIATKSFTKDYLAYLRSRTNPGSFINKLKKPVVVDYMWGSSAGLMGQLVKSKKIIEIRTERDPLFGGLHPEPIEENLKELKTAVLKNKAAMGVALDGDGDRFALIDDKGRYLTPCQIFPVIIDYLVTQRKIKGKVVQSVSLGYLSERVAKAHGLEFEQMPVGFKHVGEAIATGKAAIGGEESGGYAWKGGLGERDGLVSALLMMEICAKLKKTPSQLVEAIEKQHGKSCFTRVDFRLHRAAVDKLAFTTKIRKRLPKKVVGTPIKDVIDFDGIKVILEDGSWILMRPSGTEPLIRTYAETDSAKRTEQLLETAARWVNAHL